MKRTLFVILAALWLLSLPATAAAADTPDPEEWIEGIWRWREENGGVLMPEQAGTSPFDWYAFDAALLARGDIAPYRAALQKAAEGESRLATDYHRQGLALAALGGDPAELILRGVTAREELGRQGASAYIWALILLDARQTPLPADSVYTREELVASLLSYQTEAGGFSLEGRIPDPDMTAMALCALYPYRAGCQRETERAWQWLSDAQLPTGGFQSWGNVNAESTAQVLIALCTWGRDPLSDPMFIKEGRTVPEGLGAYRREDGSFAHTPGGDSNLTASEQALRACIAWQRFKSGGSRLYDLTDGRPPRASADASASATAAVTTTAATAAPTEATAAPSSAAVTSASDAAAAETAPTAVTAPATLPPTQDRPEESVSSPWLLLPGGLLLLGAGLYLWRRRR